MYVCMPKQWLTDRRQRVVNIVVRIAVVVVVVQENGGEYLKVRMVVKMPKRGTIVHDNRTCLLYLE